VKRLLVGVLSLALATPAFAANVYLKGGGVIQAKRVWREGGKVHVLATRHTLTTFEPSEIDLKRTFIKRHRAVKKVEAPQPQAAQAKVAAPAPKAAAAPQKSDEKKASIKLPMPKLPEKSPESLVPSSGGGGSIKQHKKEMAEKTAD
jgi:hypothetical protein